MYLKFDYLVILNLLIENKSYQYEDTSQKSGIHMYIR